ncbi:MAG TPA: hypothetical protein DD381_09940 [Lentisphaeria bacterium]|nr:MAG: hypothetical protein A2X47_13925 [Lentisphaerae bacterium GWF2_38_69]HBM16645.1 hypothetical protein [Lentisphaeria bacterium]
MYYWRVHEDVKEANGIKGSPKDRLCRIALDHRKGSATVFIEQKKIAMLSLICTFYFGEEPG